jgi:predicted RNA binding protein YcfA (HicA-like mRNA interferase family)
MTRLPRVTARELLRALERAGFAIVRSKGSHHFLQHRVDPTRRTIVAMHSGDLPPGTVSDILKQARISRDEFLELL